MCSTTTPEQLDQAEAGAAPYRCAGGAAPCGDPPSWRCRVRWSSGELETVVTCAAHLRALAERGRLMAAPEPYQEPT